MDNLGSHNGKAVRQVIVGAGARRLFLPLYFPDLNPIDEVFSRLKHLIRKVRERNVEDLWHRIGEVLGQLKQSEFADYFVNSGYASN